MEGRDKTLEFLRLLRSMDYIHPEDIPGIDLYMDQVTTFMEQNLASNKRTPDEKILTKTMINNYAKNHVMPAPNKKKYSREHMIALIFIYYMKDYLSIGDIDKVLHPITDKYFGQKENGLNMEDIYKNIVESEDGEISYLVRDILRKERRSEEAFRDAPEEEQEELQRFSLLCMLGFDVYVKKMLINYLIDNHETEPEK